MTYLSVKRHLSTGQCFDIKVACDLNAASHQQGVWHDLDVAKPLAVVMAPTCKPLCPRAALNRSIKPDAWLGSYEHAAPHGRFCEHVAKRQVINGRFFLNEQPFPSELYHETPWEEVRNMPGLLKIVFDQCMAGVVTSQGGIIKKPTTGVSNSYELLIPFIGLVC